MNKLMRSSAFVLIVFIFTASDALKYSSLDLSYQKGLDAYGGERWTECIAQFEGVIHLYKLFKSVMINCRSKCYNLNHDSLVPHDFQYLKIYEKFFTQGRCLQKCYKSDFENVRLSEDVQRATLDKLEHRKPYEYLQICYFNMYNLPKAASAAYTYLVANPTDEKMVKNLNFYLEQQEVDYNEVVDLESEDFEVLYDLGVKAYKQKNWRETIASMEEALNEYIHWENDCRLQCEYELPEHWSSEFLTSVSHTIFNLLQCQQHCQNKVSSLSFDSGVDFISELLNYLQISSYNVEKYENTAKYVASFLTLKPNDTDMLENKSMYLSFIAEKYFISRSDIDTYLERDITEKKLLNLFMEDANSFSQSS